MQIKIRAWDTVNKRMRSWEELLAGKEFKLNIREPGPRGLNLMLWTGLKDKDGVEIYEGDVLRGEFEYTDFKGVSHTEFCIGAVEYSEIRGCYMVDSGDPESDELVNWLEDTVIAVIGNIYENPELMEGGGVKVVEVLEAI